MKKMALIGIIALACAFYAGYLAGGGRESAGEQERPTIYSQWIKAEKPPIPKVAIDGKDMVVKRGSYTWCQPGSGETNTCTSVDAAAIPEPEPVSVKGGSLIQPTAPERIKELTLINTSKGFSGDAYYVPTAKGVYTYRIYCEWFLDQGQADFFFTVKVE
ncbi:hypothetical protein [Paenibacillus montanisoli]|uniref:Uncharacterized protein n=1 Tax=Paenibacillus montanisoli TaxID=2081970 RepID=A0A328TVZ6_9BACL|nr:hypothetical protein [Paenibacillus montanisoli]RAP74668.1 hypothetical protein DL346_21715 [Paenibacillus montanisoli]